jgi:uncharacterized protein (TIGR02147 family)
MAEVSIFQNEGYKGYLNAKIASLPRNGRGFKAQLAEKIGCQKAFVSQVLQGESHFNLEHGDKINHALHHDKEEAAFFLLLIQHARAGTESLRRHFQEQIETMREKRAQLKNRLRSDRDLSQEQKGKYYSSWIYGAIRVALTVPQFQTKVALIQKLGITEDRLNEAVAFLEEAGLIERRNEKFLPTALHLHIGNDQDLIVRHHTNWRLRTLDAIANPQREDLHYSSVVSLSVADAARLKSLILDFIEKSRKIVEASPEEELYTFCADFFAL